jgi:hypothetical protein
MASVLAENRFRARRSRPEDERVSDAEARMRVHDAYDLIEEQFNRELDGSLGPSGPDSLFRYVAEMRLPAGAVAVDAGCGEGKYHHEHAPDRSRHLLHAARLLSDPGRYIARFSRENYDIKLGDCLWHVYRMIGKLSSRVYLLSAPGPSSGPRA